MHRVSQLHAGKGGEENYRARCERRLFPADASYFGDDLGEFGVVAWRHDVHACRAGQLAQLFDELEANASTFANRLRRPFKPLDHGVGDD